MTVSEARLERPSAYSMAMNYVPLLFVLAGIWFATQFSGGWPSAILLGLVWLYLVPPVACRLITSSFGRPSGELRQSDAAYRVWWALTQLQMPFNRLPFLEELLRLVPCLYSFWIWLWGGSLSPLAYIGPGVTITDRFAVRIGKRAVLGTRSSYAGHMARRNAAGEWVVLIEAPDVGAEALVGGDAGLGPGAKLMPGAFLPYGRKVGPQTVWPRQAS